MEASVPPEGVDEHETKEAAAAAQTASTGGDRARACPSTLHERTTSPVLDDVVHVFG